MSVACPGTEERPLRVAVIGAGPAGFYAVEALIKRTEIHVDVDLLERLPAPYGLLRYGVAPDHPKIKSVSAAYDRIAADPRVRFLGNVALAHADSPEAGVALADLLAHYDQIVVATGCETDRRLGIPGEDLAGSHSATSFVAWYNGHPYYADLSVDLQTERAVVVGIGDVAMDLARILLRNPDELATTDITSDSLALLRGSRVREVVILARRGPGQAAFAAKELEDIAELDGVDVEVDAELVRDALGHVDPHCGTERHKLEVLTRLAENKNRTQARRLVLRFLASPMELVGEQGRVSAVRVEDNELVVKEDGTASAHGTGETELLSAGLVLRSVGYRGVALEGLPFDQSRGIVPNVEGRVQRGSDTLAGVYVAGWIKRGASGVVGTNKGDAAATVVRMIEDLGTLPAKEAAAVSRTAIDQLLRERGVEVVCWEGWKRIDQCERERGSSVGKPREKLIRTAEMLAAARGEIS